jgi:hypothetical protein
MEIRPDHGWETVGQGAPLRRGVRGGGVGSWVGVPRPSPPRPQRPRRPPPPLGPGGGAPRREAGGEAEDGGGAATGTREVEDECVVEAGVVAPGELLQGKGITDLQESGWRCWCVRSVRTAS